MQTGFGSSKYKFSPYLTIHFNRTETLFPDYEEGITELSCKVTITPCDYIPASQLGGGLHGSNFVATEKVLISLISPFSGTNDPESDIFFVYRSEASTTFASYQFASKLFISSTSTNTVKARIVDNTACFSKNGKTFAAFYEIPYGYSAGQSLDLSRIAIWEERNATFSGNPTFIYTNIPRAYTYDVSSTSVPVETTLVHTINFLKLNEDGKSLVAFTESGFLQHSLIQGKLIKYEKTGASNWSLVGSELLDLREYEAGYYFSRTNPVTSLAKFNTNDYEHFYIESDITGYAGTQTEVAKVIVPYNINTLLKSNEVPVFDFPHLDGDIYYPFDTYSKFDLDDNPNTSIGKYPSKTTPLYLHKQSSTYRLYTVDPSYPGYDPAYLTPDSKYFVEVSPSLTYNRALSSQMQTLIQNMEQSITGTTYANGYPSKIGRVRVYKANNGTWELDQIIYPPQLSDTYKTDWRITGYGEGFGEPLGINEEHTRMVIGQNKSFIAIEAVEAWPPNVSQAVELTDIYTFHFYKRNNDQWEYEDSTIVGDLTDKSFFVTTESTWKNGMISLLNKNGKNHFIVGQPWRASNGGGLGVPGEYEGMIRDYSYEISCGAA